MPTAFKRGDVVDEARLVIFETASRPVQVRLDGDTLWLTQRQMADVFDSSIDNVGLHLKNIYVEQELNEEATTEDFSVVQFEGSRQVNRRLKHYNLDAIISVGYRVNSKRGVTFRQWATGVLSEHLTRGYTLNAQRLAEKGLGSVQEAVALMAQTLRHHSLVTDEGAAVLSVVQRYLGSFRLLLAYDEGRLPLQPTAPQTPKPLPVADARAAVAILANTLAEKGVKITLFGREHD